jgi:hypothetical protein
MIFNQVITDIYLMDNPRIKVKYAKYITGDVLDLKVDDVTMGTLVYSDGSVFYKDYITVGNSDIARREYFLSKVIYKKILSLKTPSSLANKMNIYKITGVKNE